MHDRREIDGLRAVAVLPVIGFHAGLPPFSGGFVGVDVFFVISGYLITGLIWPEVAADRFSLVRFYERRARRILPALTLVCVATVSAAAVLLPPGDIAELLRSLTAVALFSSNLYFWDNASYFAPAAELAPLLHTWSLGVEEQFYVLFPLLILLLRHLRPAKVAVILLVAAALSLGLAEALLPVDPAAAFYLLPTRAWELCAGAAVALLPVPDRVPPRIAGAAALAGLALIAVAVVAFGPQTPFPGVAALVPVAGTCLVLRFARTGTLAAALLSLPPLVGIGLVSYSAYLWHQPLLALARAASPEPLGTGATLMLAAAAVALVPTWRFVEQPFRDRARVGRRGVFAAAAASTVLLILVGTLGRAPLTAVSLLAYDADERRVLDMVAAEREAEEARGRLDAGTECRFWTPGLHGAVEARLARCAARHGAGTLVVGDSHAIDLFRAFASASAQPFLVGLSDGGCRLGHGADGCFYPALPALLAAHPGLRVVFTQAGMYLLRDTDGGPGTRKMFDKPVAAPFLPDSAAIAAVADYLDALPADVEWWGPWIEPHLSERALVASGCAAPPPLRPYVVETFVALDRALARAAEGRRVRYVSLIDALAFDAARDVISCAAVYFSDTDHWSRAGEALFGARLRAAGLIE